MLVLSLCFGHGYICTIPKTLHAKFIKASSHNQLIIGNSSVLHSFLVGVGGVGLVFECEIKHHTDQSRSIISVDGQV